VHVWRANLDRTAEDVRQFQQLLSVDEQERAARYHFPRDRDHFIVGRGLLRTILGHYLERDPAGLSFCYNPQGKPGLDRESALAFNVAHSHGLALYAFTQGRAVGVDVEKVRAEVAHE